MISRKQFETRFVQICATTGALQFPRRQQDQDIFLRAAALCLEPARSYAEPELSALLESWLHRIGAQVAIDHVSLRRYLVDRRYLLRDPFGRSYRVASLEAFRHFDPEVARSSPLALLETERERRQEKKDRWLKRSREAR